MVCPSLLHPVTRTQPQPRLRLPQQEPEPMRAAWMMKRCRGAPYTRNTSRHVYLLHIKDGTPSCCLRDKERRRYSHQASSQIKGSKSSGCLKWLSHLKSPPDTEGGREVGDTSCACCRSVRVHYVTSPSNHNAPVGVGLKLSQVCLMCVYLTGRAIKYSLSLSHTHRHTHTHMEICLNES